MTTVELGKLMASLRKMKGYTQEKLAEASGIPSRTIERLESGENITIDVLLLLMKTLDLEFVIQSK